MCGEMNVRQLRGYWEDLPAESPNRDRYAPPDAPNVQPWMALVAMAAGIWVALSDAVLVGLGIVAAGLVWGVVMQRQVSAYRADLADYNASTICLVGYHVF